MEWFSSSLTVLTLEWVIRLVFVPMIALRYRPPAALAWVAVVSFQPFVGLILFLIFGNTRLPKKRIAEHALIRDKLREHLRPMLQPFWVDRQFDTGNPSRHILSVELGEMPAVTGNTFELIPKTNDFIDRLIEDIEEATETVHLLFYIWRDDETGQRVCDAVIEAEKRGVECRILADAVGSRNFLIQQSTRLIEAGVRVYPILPVNIFRRRAHRIDMRNHRKLVIIDGKIGYTGSQNIVNPDYGTRRLIWHDLMMRVTGPIVPQIQSVFCTDWFAESEEHLDYDECFKEPTEVGECTLQLFPSGPTYHTQNLHRLIVAAIYAARKEIVITTPYFVPDESLLQAIDVARLRGVRVILLVPEKSDQILVAAAQRSFYHELLDMGVEIQLFQSGLLHSKTLTIDDRISLVGTSNMDIRSFALNLEINLILFDQQTIQTVLDQQKSYLERSRPLTSEEWDQRETWKLVGDGLARLLAPLL